MLLLMLAVGSGSIKGGYCAYHLKWLAAMPQIISGGMSSIQLMR